MKANSRPTRSHRRPARLAAATPLVSGSRATARESQLTIREPRCTSFGSLLTSYYSLITHLLISSAPTTNDRNSSAINAQRLSNRSKLGCLCARCSRFFRSTNHQPHRPTRHFLIAGEKILKTELTPSVPSPNALLIAGDFPSFSPATPRISNRYTKLLEIELSCSQQTRKHFLIATICPVFALARQLTAHHSHPASRAFLIPGSGITNVCNLRKTNNATLANSCDTAFLRRFCSPRITRSSDSQIAGDRRLFTTHQSHITSHKSRVMNRDSRYNCGSQCAVGQSNRQPKRAAGHRQPARHETGFGLRSSNIPALKRTTHEPAR